MNDVGGLYNPASRLPIWHKCNNNAIITSWRIRLNVLNMNEKWKFHTASYYDL